jgi:DNA-binding Lrp family transcriptional regulator
MRNSSNDNAIRHPLNEVLGTEAGVRLLRVLAHEVDGPLSPADAAERAGLTAVGARKALSRLVRSGVVARTGKGRSRHYELRENEPLLSALKGLFESEQARFDAFIRQLREVFIGIHEVRTAWVKAMPTKLGEALEIQVVADTGAVSWIGEELRTRLSPLERRLDQIIELGIFTRADAPDPVTGSLTLLTGVVRDAAEPMPPGPDLHPGKDKRAARLSHGIASLVEADPSIITRAIRHLDRLINEGQGNATPVLIEWRQLLQTYSPERVKQFLVSESPRAVRLRQSSPFFAVLTSEERDALLTGLETQP